MTSDAIIKSVEVPISALDAFTLFTERMDTWWPLQSHSVSAGRDMPPSEEIEVEPRVGGKVTEKLKDGEDALWGEVLEWEPGARFRMTWVPGKSAAMPTEVAVTFIELGNGCRVELVHSGFEAYESGTQVKANYEKGWGMLVGTLFAQAAGIAKAA